MAAAAALAREAALRTALDSAAQVVVVCAHAIIIAYYCDRCEMCACGGATRSWRAYERSETLPSIACRSDFRTTQP